MSITAIQQMGQSIKNEPLEARRLLKEVTEPIDKDINDLLEWYQKQDAVQLLTVFDKALGNKGNNWEQYVTDNYQYGPEHGYNDVLIEADPLLNQLISVGSPALELICFSYMRFVSYYPYDESDYQNLKKYWKAQDDNPAVLVEKSFEHYDLYNSRYKSLPSDFTPLNKAQVAKYGWTGCYSLPFKEAMNNSYLSQDLYNLLAEKVLAISTAKAIAKNVLGYDGYEAYRRKLYGEVVPVFEKYLRYGIQNKLFVLGHSDRTPDYIRDYMRISPDPIARKYA